MTNNLIPKVITDKNGVTTTKWVKPEADSSSNGRTMPPVVIAPQEDEAANRKTILTDLYTFFVEYGEHEDDVDDASSLLPKLQTHTLTLIRDFILDDDGDVDSDNAYYASSWVLNHGSDETYLREMFSYASYFDKSTSGQFIEATILKLPHCAELPTMDDYSHADDAARATIQEMITEVEGIYDTDLDPSYQNIILSSKMRELMNDNPEQLDRIKTIMAERGTEDYILVQSILDSEAPAISSGTL